MCPAIVFSGEKVSLLFKVFNKTDYEWPADTVMTNNFAEGEPLETLPMRLKARHMMFLTTVFTIPSHFEGKRLDITFKFFTQ